MVNKKHNLSVLIPARNEEFLKRTVDDILENKKGNTEIIVVLDGAWASPPLDIHPDITVIYHHESIGQRAATNEAARLSESEFIMKCDAHCAFGEGFDVKLMARCEDDWTVVPRMYNLHVFNWVCKKCGWSTYQGRTPKKCEKCDNTADFEKVMVWKPKKSPETDFMRFDQDLVFKYWSGFKKRPEAVGDFALTMSLLGACWFLRQKRYWELDGLDEAHGSWGQMGTEIACKSWLSGGKLIVNKTTWFAHMFRTQGGDFGFPYPLRKSDTNKAREHSRNLWINGKWPKAIHSLQWLIDKFAPVPDWNDHVKKAILFYTDNQLNVKIAKMCQNQLRKISKEKNIPIISASLKPMHHFGKNVHLPLRRGYLTMFKQILAGLETADADVVFFCEHDVLYHPSHFDFTPPKKYVYYYNENVWKVRWSDGHALHYDCKQTSGLCAYRETLIRHYKERIRRVEKEGFSRRMGFEPGTHGRKERVDDLKAEAWRSEYPNVDIRHDNNLTPSRWRKDQFRDKRYTKGWIEADEVPGWGKLNGLHEDKKHISRNPQK